MSTELSEAHRKSASYIIDPVYDPFHCQPEAPLRKRWLYPRAVYEYGILNRMRIDVYRARLLAGYDMTRIPGSPSTTLYRRRFSAGTVSFETSTGCSVRLDGEEKPFLETGKGGLVSFQLDHPATVIVMVRSANPEYCMAGLSSDLEGWEASSVIYHYNVCEAKEFGPAEEGGDPVRYELPEVELIPQKIASGLYDAGRELFGYVEVYCEDRPGFSLGESIPEAENEDPVCAEQVNRLYGIEKGVWRTAELCAFRYLKIRSEKPCKVVCRACFAPEQYKGAFAADPELTKIWMTSAYTVRLCMDFFVLDGIKRDRLPWMGDHLVSMLADAAVFYDAEISRRTLTVLGNPGVRKGDINGILDYTFWLAVASDHFQRYWGDAAFLKKQYPELADTADTVLERVKDTVYMLPGHTWFFLDWTPEEKFTGEQILLYYALHSFARLAERMDDTDRKARLLAHAEKLRAKLFAEAYDPEKKMFRAHPDKPECGFNRYANMLAILCGLADESMCQAISGELAGDKLPLVGTPYMNTLECLALYRAGYAGEALTKIRQIWGAMLKLDATTFWEGYDPRHKGNEHYAFYGRPFGKSLCHAWSSGPAYLLPLILFGAEPLEDGWKVCKVAPAKDLLQEGDCVTIPVPDGTVQLLWHNGELEIEKPASIRIVQA